MGAKFSNVLRRSKQKSDVATTTKNDSDVATTSEKRLVENQRAKQNETTNADAADDFDEIALRNALQLSDSEEIIPKYLAAVSGKGVQIQNNRLVVRRDFPFALESSCLIFSDLTLQPGSTLYFRILGVYAQPDFYIGMTSCKPSNLRAFNLPVDPTELVDRPEYWVIGKIEQELSNNDFLTLTFQADGKLIYKVNNNPPSDLFYCDISQPLWLYVDLGNLKKILLIGGSVCDEARQHPGFARDDDTASSSSENFAELPTPDSLSLNNSDRETGNFAPTVYKNVNVVIPRVYENVQASAIQTDKNDRSTLSGTKTERKILSKQENDIAHTDSSSEGEYQSSDDSTQRSRLPPTTLTSIGASGVTKNFVSCQPGQPRSLDSFDQHSSDEEELWFSDAPTVTQLQDVSRAENESSYMKSIPLIPTAPDEEILKTDDKQTGASSSSPSDDKTMDQHMCSVCYDSRANSVIYDCGHICMCFDCGKALLRSERFAKCPICRKSIKDIIETFHS